MKPREAFSGIEMEGRRPTKGSPKKWRLDEPASVWKEKEIIDGKLVEAGVVILQTRGCSHYHSGGCSMCGYNYRSGDEVSADNLMKQFRRAADGFGDIRFLKVYTSGSFLDECEVPKQVATAVLENCRDRGLRLLFETRPEYVSATRLDEILSVHSDLEVALGLESANDRILQCSINKGFTVHDYDNASSLLRRKKVGIRTYVLLKPPFLTEAEAVRDAIATIRHASKVSTTLSLNPVNVQNGTLVERLWKNWSYRPPWLWSVLEVLRTTKGLDARVVCDPTGGGKERGAHNCGKCDGVILDSIRNFSLSQDHSRLGSPECACRDLWSAVMDMEGFVAGGTVDLQRFFRRQRA